MFFRLSDSPQPSRETRLISQTARSVSVRSPYPRSNFCSAFFWSCSDHSQAQQQTIAPANPLSSYVPLVLIDSPLHQDISLVQPPSDQQPSDLQPSDSQPIVPSSSVTTSLAVLDVLVTTELLSKDDLALVLYNPLQRTQKKIIWSQSLSRISPPFVEQNHTDQIAAFHSFSQQIVPLIFYLVPVTNSRKLQMQLPLERIMVTKSQHAALLALPSND